MSLFQNSVVTKQLQNQDKANLALKWSAFKEHFHNPVIQENIRSSKEEQYQGEFLIDLFVNVLGYAKNPTPNFTLTTEYKNVKDSKKADGAIVINEKVKAVIELKGTNTTDLGKIEDQAFRYKNNQPQCTYIITSNYEKLRFYIDNATEYLELNLFQLSEKEFELLYLCLAFENISNDVPKKLKEQSLSKEKDITQDLYRDYSLFKRELHQDLVKNNPDFDALILFQKSQKLLDRFLFLFFAEDRQLLPPNSVRLILNDWRDLQERDEHVPLYKRFKKYFEYLNTGFKGKRYDVFAYNGGLFKPDEILDTIKIDDELLYKHTLKLSEYDFVSEVDVNILGHIFENSLNELDEIKAQLEGRLVEKGTTKRKKDGVFYTPKYITKYIVENTVGKLCTDQKQEFKIVEEDYFTDKKRNVATRKTLLEKLNNYKNWLLQITICDPACGSGAFLNQALEFLIAEHRYIDELQAKLFGDALVLSDIEKSILENNLFGVDLNEESVEIAKLSLWLRTAQPNRKLNDLNNNIKCGNSLIDDFTVVREKAFNWKSEFPAIFKNGGFDVIIGNPPYVQIQSMGAVSKTLESQKFQTFEKTGDLYCLFYELGNILLKSNGILGYITSNKWLRANYGKSLRNYLLENTQTLELLDLGSGIFESATVDSNILIFQKSIINEKPFIGLDITKESVFTDFTSYKSKKVLINPKKDEIWNISNPIEIFLKQKVERIGIPIKNWEVKINRGLTTGLNEAFIIDELTKNTLINENFKCADLIKPILRGKDLNRYRFDSSNLFIINTHNGYKDNLRVDIAEFSNIRKHLSFFEPQLSLRFDKGETSFHLRNCAYLDEFKKEKIIFSKASKIQAFCLDSTYNIVLNTAYILTGESLKFLLTILNSKFAKFLFLKFYQSGGIQGEITIQAIENIPIPKIEKSDEEPFKEKGSLMIYLTNELIELSKSFQRTLQRKFELETLPKKLQEWYLLSYSDFINELTKQKIKLTLSQEAEWEEYFNAEAIKALTIKKEIDATDKAIDQMVYELYELTPEEIEIVESS